MDFSTIYNNVAFETYDTSETGITRAKRSVNDAYFDIINNSRRWSWAIDRTSPKSLTLSISANTYDIDNGIGRIGNVWYERSGRIYIINIIDNITDFNKFIINDPIYATIVQKCYIDYNTNKIFFDVYPSQSFINTYGDIYYVGKEDVAKLSADLDIPSIPTRLHRKLEELAILYRKKDKESLNLATFEGGRKIIIDYLENEDDSFSDNQIELDTARYDERTNFDYEDWRV